MKDSIVKVMLYTVLLGGTTAVSAQTDAHTGATTKARTSEKIDTAQVAAHQTAHMAKELSLTPEQQAKVLEIVKKYVAQKPTKAQLAKKDAEIEAVLTSEQKAKYADFLKKVAEWRKKTAQQRP